MVSSAVFASFAEALAEGRSKGPGGCLHGSRRNVMAKKLSNADRRSARAPITLVAVPIAAALSAIAFTGDRTLVWIGVAVWGIVNESSTPP